MKSIIYSWSAAIILALSLILAASALSSYSASYVISGDTVNASVSLNSADLYNYSYIIPAGSVDVNCSINCTVIRGKTDIAVALLEHSSMAHISFKSSAFLDHGKYDYFLLDFSGINSQSRSISVTLPEYATLSHPLSDNEHASVVPATSDVTTNGVSITIRWDNESLSQNGALMVVYKQPGNRINIWVIVLVMLSAIAIAASIYFSLLGRSKGSASAVLKEKPRTSVNSEGFGKEETKENNEVSKEAVSEITRNLYEDEKKIIYIIHEAKGEVWQKELQLKTGLSKVRLSRRLRSLEERKIIEKVPVGNTNRIRLINEGGKKSRDDDS